MEIQYTYVEPKTMIVRSPNFQDHSFDKVNNWPPTGHRVVNYSPSLPEPNRWTRSSTGGLAGINSPFSETLSKYSVYPQEIASRNIALKDETPKKTTNFHQTVKGRPTIFPGQPKAIIKRGYYKEFVAASLFRKSIPEEMHRAQPEHTKNADADSHRRMTNGYCHTAQEEKPVQKRSRSLRACEDDSRPVSAFSIVKRKGNNLHSSIQERLKALPPPPPLVKVVKRSQHEMRRTPNPKDGRFNSKPHRIPEVSQTKTRQQGSERIPRPWSSEPLRHAFREYSTPGEANVIRRDRRSEPAQNRKIQDMPEREGLHQRKIIVPINSQRSTVLIPCNSGSQEKSGRCPVHSDANISAREIHRYSKNNRKAEGYAESLENKSPTRQQNIRPTQGSIDTSEKQHKIGWGIQGTPLTEERRATPWPEETHSITRSPVDIHKTTSTSQESRFTLVSNEVLSKPSIQNQMSKKLKSQHTAHNDVIVIRDSPPPSKWHDRTSQWCPNSRTAWRSYSFESNKTFCQHGLNNLQNQEEMSKEKPADKRLWKKCRCQCAICREMSEKLQTEQLPSPKSRTSSSSCLSAPSILKAPCSTPCNTVMAAPEYCNKKLHRSYSTHDIYSVRSYQCNDNPFERCFTLVNNHQFKDPSQDTGKTQTGCMPEAQLPETLTHKQSEVNSFLGPIRPEMPSPNREKEPQHDKNKNEIFPLKTPQRRATTSQERQILVDKTQEKTLKRAFSEGDASTDKELCDETLLKLPVDEEKDKSNSYGGFAYDHESLPIIVAVHSIGAENHQSANDAIVDKKRPINIVEKTSSDVQLQTNLEVPKQCIVLPQTQKVEPVSTSPSTTRTSAPTSNVETKDAVIQETSKQHEGSLTDLKSTKMALETSEPVSNQIHFSTNNLPKNQTLTNGFVKANNKAEGQTKNNIQCVKPQRKEVSVESLSKKILETRQRIEDENIDWKKKLLGRLEYVLTKRLRKMERLTGVKSTLEFPTEKEKPKTLSKTLTTEKTQEEKTVAVKDVVKKDRKNTKQILKRKKYKLKKLTVTSKGDDPSSDYELTIEETQESQETNSEVIDFLIN
ncbi:uncharacterized protein LOC110242044 [Exaiptasia diaphana]|uniref:Uncharacterized protein n=1 Tax=Exaiptasia diaphana TaxID=2652724 RepID=A0A913XFK5_EXADI|nr:uncharacterized protein LOC110242044 [Exaiptasia diaphana]XP_020903639.1 uncharacterized protein LOC110242044 [Exaiptasia diaphana]XP_020903640.1 uncharacterized protein LOC110242044 [Exaiptasia diaphana]XP_020903641.1 uncharacterized protein LOC110242044 [Exaiptasia diaphana]XP_020903642.1 uncharacterized protein LOC110242044 [Exaiptasia diaphana]XP_020903644.1 uncharacterized protein LOC110242044 [Exaiptasia diaphana]XP_028515764.1 uncharacterized protein LOC110242044 [Exaiptasia diaphan